MTAKKKELAKNKTDLADVLNKIDGLYKGYSRAEIRGALKLLLVLEQAVIKEGKTKSLCLMLRSQAKKKVKK